MQAIGRKPVRKPGFHLGHHLPEPNVLESRVLDEDVMTSRVGEKVFRRRSCEAIALGTVDAKERGIAGVRVPDGQHPVPRCSKRRDAWIQTGAPTHIKEPRVFAFPHW